MAGRSLQDAEAGAFLQPEQDSAARCAWWWGVVGRGVEGPSYDRVGAAVGEQARPLVGMPPAWANGIDDG